MRFNVSATKAVREHPMYNKFEELLAAAGAVVVGYTKKGVEGEVVDIQVNTIPLERAAGQFIFTTGGVFEEASAGRSHLTMEIDHVDDITAKAVGNQLLCYMACAVASAMFPAGLTVNVNCWGKQHGHAGRTGWFEGRVDSLPANHVVNYLVEFIAGERTIPETLMACSKAFRGNVK